MCIRGYVDGRLVRAAPRSLSLFLTRISGKFSPPRNASSLPDSESLSIFRELPHKYLLYPRDRGIACDKFSEERSSFITDLGAARRRPAINSRRLELHKQSTSAIGRVQFRGPPYSIIGRSTAHYWTWVALTHFHRASAGRPGPPFAARSARS